MTITNTGAHKEKKKREMNKIEESPPPPPPPPQDEGEVEGGDKGDTVSYHSSLLLKVSKTFDCLQEKS